MSGEAKKINIILSLTLKVGAYIGIFFITFGLIIFIMTGGTFSANVKIIPITSAFSRLLSFDPLSFITVGLVVLIMTPAIRVLAAAISFLLVEKDKKYFLISLGVFVILLVSIKLASGVS